MHSRKSLVFDQNTEWVKRGDGRLFDVTMGSYDGEVCQPVGLYILNRLSENSTKITSVYIVMTGWQPSIISAGLQRKKK